MLTLDEKIAGTESLMQTLVENVDPDGVRVAWTGGKDSTVVLFIWKAVLDNVGKGPVHAINLDTGCKFTEVMAFRDVLTVEWGIDLHIARPEVSLDGYPLAQDPLSCCRELKVEPLKRAVVETGATHVLSGIRFDEHPDRVGRRTEEQRNDPPHYMINPILDWTETDIWAFHARFNLPHCELYDQGYRSLGCKPCTQRPDNGGCERSGRAASKEAVLPTLTSLGYF